MASSFLFSSGALRSLQLEAEEQERWEMRRKLSRMAVRPSHHRHLPANKPPQRPPRLSTDPLFHMALFTGNLETLQELMGAEGSANLLVPTRSHDLRWSSQQAGK